MRDSRRIIRSGLLGSLLMVLLASNTLAYIGQNRWTVTVTADATSVRCGQTVKFTATVLEASTNRPARDKKVTWALTTSQSRHDWLHDTTTYTNGSGKTWVKLTLGYKSGIRVVTATVDGVRGTSTVTCTTGSHWHWHGWGLAGSSHHDDARIHGLGRFSFLLNLR